MQICEDFRDQHPWIDFLPEFEDVLKPLLTFDSQKMKNGLQRKIDAMKKQLEQDILDKDEVFLQEFEHFKRLKTELLPNEEAKPKASNRHN